MHARVPAPEVGSAPMWIVFRSSSPSSHCDVVGFDDRQETVITRSRAFTDAPSLFKDHDRVVSRVPPRLARVIDRGEREATNR